MTGQSHYADAIEELAELAMALRMEREEEEHRYASIVNEVSVKQRRNEGLTRSPLTVSRVGYVTGGAPQITLERPKAEYPLDQFTPGSPVFIYPVGAPEERTKGIATKVDNTLIEIELGADELPDDSKSMSYTVDLRFDDKTFFEMERALNVLINAEKTHSVALRDRLLGYAKMAPERDDEETRALLTFMGSRLNPSQREAVRKVVQTNDIALVHGPPGTGKTTTLVEAIRLVSRTKERILVCAPTNAAADLLTLKLASAGVDVLRMGHSSRLAVSSFNHSFDTRLEQMPEMRFVEELRRRADRLTTEAHRHVRNYGPEERKQRSEAKAEAKALRNEARDNERFAEQKLLTQAQAVTCTLVGSSDKRLRAIDFDLVVIDEAGQALEPAAWIAILKAKRVVLAGDPYQLPPTVKSPQAERMGLAITLLEKAIARTESAVLLDTQYRMNDAIMGYSNAYFYQGRLKAHPSVKHHALSDDEPVVEFIDTAGTGFSEAHPEDGGSESIWNREEADLLVKRLNELRNEHGDAIKSIGVIAPYRAQVNYLKTCLSEDDQLAIQTVDGFQGQERDAIAISLTRSNDQQRIGFLSDYRRMNVAMTRAKRKLIVIGDSATLGADQFYSGFMAYCEAHSGYRSAFEYLYPQE
jgi:superfamily I DNA and/or RNA helicase